MRVVTLLVRHGSSRYPSAIEDIDRFFAERLPGVERELVVIDNSLPEDYAVATDAGYTILGSSNAHWEFSAWDRGIEFLGTRIEKSDYVHLVTSAFRTLY